MGNEAGIKLDLRQRLHSFGHAFSGGWYVLRTQPNARIHAIVSVFVFGLALWFRLPALEWAVLMLTVMAVWMAEFFNTALEAMVDLVSPEFHPLAKAAKDVAAAGVLVGAISAVVIGLLILGPPLWSRLFQ